MITLKSKDLHFMTYKRRLPAVNTQDFKLIGLQIRYFREAKKISQEQLANQAGLATGTIGKIERGLNNPKADTLLRIAAELEIPCQLLFEKNDRRRTYFSPQIHRLVQYAKCLSDDEVNALCVIARTLDGTHRGGSWNDPTRRF